MSIRDEISSLDKVAQAIDEFLKWPDKRVLLLNGKWGVGKSYFLRKYIAERLALGESTNIPPWIAYLSLFGSTSIEQIEGRLIGSLQPRKLWNRSGPKVAAEIAKKVFESFKLTLFGVGIGFPSVPSTVVADYIVRTNEVLVILDDLERSASDLKFTDVLGWVGSKIETAFGQLKFILICNVDKIDEVQNGAWSGHREKVISTRLQFDPTPEEVIQKFGHSDEVRQVLRECLPAMKSINIRIVVHIVQTVDRIKSALLESGVQTLPGDIESIVKCVALYFSVSAGLRKEWLEGVAHRNLGERVGLNVREVQPTHSTDPLEVKKREDKEMAKAMGILPSVFNEYVIELLDQGYVDESTNQKVLNAVKSNRLRNEYEAATRNAQKALQSGFGDLTVAEVESSVGSVLDKYAALVPLEDFVRSELCLRALSVDTSKWWIMHINALPEKPDQELLLRYKQAVPMKELHSLIEGKFGQVRQKKGLKKAIKAIGESLSSNSVDFEEILEAGPDNVIDCIRQIEDSSFWRPFRFFLGRLMGEGSANALEMHQRIWEELTRLAKLNAVNRRRIMWLIGLELTDEGILIDTAAKIKMDQP